MRVTRLTNWLQPKVVCMRRRRSCRRDSHGATTRAYYAVFHGARALLFSIGLEVSSHRGLVSLVGDHFVKPGRLSSDLGRLVSRLQRDREDADYSLGAVFTDDDAARAIAEAVRFLNAVRGLLKEA